ncbi:MAG TPA: 2-oxoacid:acceptor oxidoreductase subunit alpha [Chloroflexota bacterium]|nr:2-oxoacid:acceptor oxidoreductase subunit alpha [Chloroflexota bacterium]
MPKNDLVIRVAGEAGEGVLSTGQLLVQGAARAGYRVLTDFSPPAEIKGGYSFFQIRIGSRLFYSRGDSVDLLLAFNREAYDLSSGDLTEGGLLIYDPAEVSPPASPTRTQYPVPLSEIARTQLKFELGKNVVAVGVLAALFGMPEEYLRKLLEQRFGGRGPDILNKNLGALEAGLRYVREHIINQPGFRRELFEVERSPADGRRIVVSGNQAASLGALTAGVQFFAGYPITPASDIMEFLAAELPKVGGAVIQAEDEIASMNMVLGASFAGKRAMTSTSGPGVSLMVEALGLASMAELPCVLVDCQRAGPSTGMPTRHEQGDLWLAAFGGHGEIQRIVLAPTSVEDCYYQIQHAFNLADKYQLPVILLLDTVLSVRTESIPRPDPQRIPRWSRLLYQEPNGQGVPPHEGIFLRYQLTDSGISPMSIPGQRGGQYVATGLEHNEEGRPRYDAETKTRFTEKRFKKLAAAPQDAPEPDFYGDASAEIGIITWGSTAGAVREAIERAAEEGIRVAGIAPKMLWPVPDAQLRPFLEGKREVMVAEVNYNGQFARILEAHWGRPLRHVNAYAGEPFKVRDLLAAIRTAARAGAVAR